MINIDKLEELPHRMGRSQYNRIGRFDDWYHHWDADDTNPYLTAERLCKHYVGKPFDEAFSHYCSKVEQRYQHIFLDTFKWRRWGGYYHIDSQGRIQEEKKRQRDKSITWYSDDYKSEVRHAITGHRKDDFEAIYVDSKRKQYWGHKPDYYLYTQRTKMLGGYPLRLKIPKHEIYKAYEKDFVVETLSGWHQVFSSKNDPRYKRLWYERQKQEKVKQKKRLLDKEEKWLEFLRKDAEQRKRLEAANLVNIERHGFDPKTSFTKRKET